MADILFSVKEIRVELIKRSMKQKDISEKLNISEVSLSRVLTGKTPGYLIRRNITQYFKDNPIDPKCESPPE